MSKRARYRTYVNPQIEWQWEDDDGTFKTYADDIQRLIAAALAQQKDHVDIKIGRFEYLLTFDVAARSGMQLNKATSHARIIRAIDIASSTSLSAALTGLSISPPVVAAAPVVPTSEWQWQDDNDWKPFDASLQTKIKNSSNVQTQIGSNTYEIDTHSFLQTNLNTGYARPIREQIIFERVDSIDWQKEIGWVRVGPNVNAPKSGKSYDPDSISKGDWEELGNGDDDEPVVELPCSTPTLPCFYRESFIVQWFDTKPECPNCKKLFSARGTQPSGKMFIFSRDARWIELHVEFRGGKQGPRQPNPGAFYTGTARHLYYPNDAQGREAVSLIKKAFLRGVLFKIGTSVTTGSSNTVIFGGIHLKTSTHGGPTNHGYPDSGWFARFKSECLTNGIE